MASGLACPVSRVNPDIRLPDSPPPATGGSTQTHGRITLPWITIFRPKLAHKLPRETVAALPEVTRLLPLSLARFPPERAEEAYRTTQQWNTSIVARLIGKRSYARSIVNCFARMKRFLSLERNVSGFQRFIAVMRAVPSSCFSNPRIVARYLESSIVERSSFFYYHYPSFFYIIIVTSLYEIQVFLRR